MKNLGTGASDLSSSVRITRIATLFHKYFSVQIVVSRCVINWRTYFLKLNKPSSKIHPAATHISEPVITGTIHKTLQPNPILRQY
jgi:hypothetical protein